MFLKLIFSSIIILKVEVLMSKPPSQTMKTSPKTCLSDWSRALNLDANF